MCKWAFPLKVLHRSTCCKGCAPVIFAADFNHDGLLDLGTGDTYGKIRIFLQARSDGSSPVFSPPIEIKGPVQKVRLMVDRIDWTGDGWDDLSLAYASNHYFVAINGAGKGSEIFSSITDEIKIPGCWAIRMSLLPTGIAMAMRIL